MGKLAQFLGLKAKANTTYNSKASVIITTEQTVVQPGQLVSGQINLQVHEPFDGQDLVLSLVGREKLKWETESTSSTTNSDGSKSRKTSTSYHNDAVTLFTNNVAVIPAQHYLPGNYVFPFQCVVPHTATASFDHTFPRVELMRNVHYRVKYTLTLTLPAHGIDQPDISTAVPIDVIVTPEYKSHPVEDTCTRQVNLLGLFRRGSCTLTGKLATNVYRAGEVASVRCSVENESSKRLRKVKVRVYQDLTMTLTKSRSMKGTMGICEVSVAGISSGEFVVSLGMAVNPSQCPGSTMVESYAGQLVRIEHRVEAKCCFTLCPSTKVDLPVVILAS